MKCIFLRLIQRIAKKGYIASVQKSDCPEELFLIPLLTKPNISPHIAATFERLTGRAIDFSLVLEMDRARRAPLLSSHPVHIAARIERDLNSNLAEWAALSAQIKLETRPTQLYGRKSGFTPECT